MKYIIGLDMGIASVGFATVMLDENEQLCRILRMNSRIFDAAEHPKDGSSLAAPRRTNRGMRRRLRRRRFRKQQIRNLITAVGIMSSEEVDKIYNDAKELTDIYKVRAESLDRLLSREEFVRLMIHLSQRRGFKSNRKVDAADSKSEAGKLLIAVKSNKQLMDQKGYRTIGEMLFKDERFATNKRNKADDYSNTFSRAEYEDEINKIFEAQQKFGNQYVTDDFRKKYLDIYLSQRAFDDGPGGNSPYAGNQIEKMLGHCTFEENEFRAVKASYSFEYFNLLSKVNSIKIVDDDGKRPLTDEERKSVIALAFAKNSITYASLRKELKLADDVLFNISYGKGEKSVEEVEKKTKFAFLTAYHTFKKAYGQAFVNWSTEKKNTLGYAITVYKNDNKIIMYLTDHEFEKAEIDIALTLPSFAKTGNLSVKALDKIIPYLEQGMLYNEACSAAGYNFKADDTSKRMYLPANAKDAPELEDIRNPVVRRAVSQTIKVINSIIREYGENPTFVNIEIARELAKNFKDRKQIERNQKENQAKNEKIMERLRNEFHILKPTGQDLIKLKLWEEQDGRCPYSQKPISIDKLFDVGYTDIDHIVPYSISFDDTYNNKVLVLSAENRMKGNRLPMQYLDGKRQDDFILWVNSAHLRKPKKDNLLKKNYTEEDKNGWKKRNLQDTQYMASFMLNYLKKYLALQPSEQGRKNQIVSVNGRATDYLRKRWGIQKIRENGDTHHAVDAVVIACMTQTMIKRISEYAKYKETEYQHPETNEFFDVDKKTGEVINRFPLPYPDFRKELDIRCSDNPARLLRLHPLVQYSTGEDIKPMFVSRMPNHKVKGAAHMETIRGHFNEDGTDYSVAKTALTSLKLKNGEIEGYFNPDSDVLLYKALKARLAQFGGDGKKAFVEPFYKPKSDGSQGPLVKKVKIVNKSTLSVPVHNGTAVADNGSMVRVDVFRVEKEGYYLVPVYVSDTVKPELPNRAVVAHKPYENWKEMDDSNFVFSLYPNDLIKLTFAKEMTFAVTNKDSTLPPQMKCKEIFAYYKGTNISTGAIGVINHDNTYAIGGLGVKRLPLIEKYQIDVLGNISKVGKEKRMRFR
ncbi:MAG: type II CRISPR RNA-guided endonuclease Cas9 [Ruminococcus sp.]|nr:type II CRISPR RNA-guided endonuclease Cas9 [Ruminococcus sp.]